MAPAGDPLPVVPRQAADGDERRPHLRQWLAAGTEEAVLAEVREVGPQGLTHAVRALHAVVLAPRQDVGPHQLADDVGRPHLGAFGPRQLDGEDDGEGGRRQRAPVGDGPLLHLTSVCPGGGRDVGPGAPGDGLAPVLFALLRPVLRSLPRHGPDLPPADGFSVWFARYA